MVVEAHWQSQMSLNSRCWASSKSSKEHGLATIDLLTRLLHPKPSSLRLAKVFSLSKVALLLNLERVVVGKALTSWSVRRRAAGICSHVEFKQLLFDTKYRQKRNINWNKPCRIRGFDQLFECQIRKSIVMQQRDRLCEIRTPVLCL